MSINRLFRYKIYTSALFLLIILSFISCQKSDKTKLTLTGSSTLAPLAAEIGKRFEQAYPKFQIDVQTGGSSKGVSDVRQGLNDIGMISRELKSSEKGLFTYAVARDGVCMIVNNANPINELSADQIRDIYTGKIKSWKELGLKDEVITTVHKSEAHSTLELFLHYFGLKNKDVHPSVIIGDNMQGIHTVEGNPWAIGYVSIGTAETVAKQGGKIKLLPLDGVQASVENLNKDLYPLSRKLYFVTKKQAHGNIKKFLDYATSAQVQDLVVQQSFIPLKK